MEVGGRYLRLVPKERSGTNRNATHHTRNTNFDVYPKLGAREEEREQVPLVQTPTSRQRAIRQFLRRSASIAARILGQWSTAHAMATRTPRRRTAAGMSCLAAHSTSQPSPVYAWWCT